MEYKRFDNVVFVRIDRGEEVISSLKTVCENESIRLASVSAIGATADFTVGVLDVDTKEYIANDFSGNHEIVSLCGNVTVKGGEFYAHLHMSAADEKGNVVGGHLNRAVISATCEMVVNVSDGTVERQSDPVTGLNIFKFDNN